MGRISINFNDKKYILEYSKRIEVKMCLAQLNEYKDIFNESLEQDLKEMPREKIIERGVKIIKVLTILIKAGLIEHHAHEMPSDEQIESWAINMPNIDMLLMKLRDMLQDIIKENGEEAKNLSWEVEAN